MTQEEFLDKLKSIGVEGARRMQNVIVSMLAISGRMDVAVNVLALNPEEVCKGESIKETVTLERPPARTDYEKLRELLDGWGVEYEAKKWEQEQVTYICVHTKECQYDVGYSCFWTEFRFTPEGKFVGMGAWE